MIGSPGQIEIGQGPPGVLFGDAFIGPHGGNDTLSDTAAAVGDADTMSDHARGGDDILIGGNDRADALVGDANRMTDHAVGGNDTLVGHAGGQSGLSGDAGEMSGQARGGNDHLIGGPSLAVLHGDATTMRDQAVGGDDVLESTGFTNRLYGDAETLADNSRGGNDVLIGGHGTDHMWGDAATVAAGALTGADTFVFGPGGGRDDINDFRQSDGDRIDVSAFGFTHLVDMTFASDGASITISFDDSSSVVLVGFADPHALHTSDFIFA